MTSATAAARGGRPPPGLAYAGPMTAGPLVATVATTHLADRLANTPHRPRRWGCCSALRALAAEHARRGAAPPAWVGRLTGRESEVLRHMAGGPTNVETARRMDVGAATVKSHVAAVPANTGTRDRTQAVIAAYEAGFLNAR